MFRRLRLLPQTPLNSGVGRHSEVVMSIENFQDPVRSRIKQLFGDTSDLSEELVNTLCNLYYFAEKAEKLNFGGLTDLQELFPSKDKAELVKMYMQHIGHVSASASHAPEMIESMRSARSQQPSLLSFLEQLTIDLFKYSIEGVERKSAIRRGFERKFKKPLEHPGLAKAFRVPFRVGGA